MFIFGSNTYYCHTYILKLQLILRYYTGLNFSFSDLANVLGGEGPRTGCKVCPTHSGLFDCWHNQGQVAASASWERPCRSASVGREGRLGTLHQPGHNQEIQHGSMVCVCVCVCVCVMCVWCVCVCVCVCDVCVCVCGVCVCVCVCGVCGVCVFVCVCVCFNVAV